MTETKKKKPKFKRDEDWVKAKAKCRLNQKDIEMAKKLGLAPRTLMKNIPSPQQRWKAPVKQWIHDLYEERFGPQDHQKPTRPHEHSSPLIDEEDVDEEFLLNCPFWV